MKILIAEDDTTSRMILEAVSKKWGYDPVAVADGSSAMQVMQQGDAPNLAILDWEMPGMSGLEVCRKIREKSTSNPPYLIILTAKGEKADIVKGLDAGANDYVAKPYDRDELQARIRVGRRMVEMQMELLEARDALEHEATHDSLTKALNRSAILSGLEKELNRAARRNSGLSIGLCDIDHFKKINDTHGHQVGDDALCRFVDAIQGNLRVYDLVGRYGGEEFLVVTPDAGKSAAEGLYERLRSRVEGTRFSTRSGEIQMTVSIGVAGIETGNTVDSILAAADAALYQAKGEGRNRVCHAVVEKGRK